MFALYIGKILYHELGGNDDYEPAETIDDMLRKMAEKERIVSRMIHVVIFWDCRPRDCILIIIQFFSIGFYKIRPMKS